MTDETPAIDNFRGWLFRVDFTAVPVIKVIKVSNPYQDTWQVFTTFAEAKLYVIEQYLQDITVVENNAANEIASLRNYIHRVLNMTHRVIIGDER